jgi:hypothetical protein
MAFFHLPFGHIEVKIDRRPPRRPRPVRRRP